MRLIDTHCHINQTKAFPDPFETIREAVDAGVSRMIVIGIDEESSIEVVELAERFEEVFAVVGWHPTHASSYTPDSLNKLAALLDHEKVLAVGEIGLDYYWDHSTPEEQHRCLVDHLDLAAEKQMPVVFHCRDAYDDLLALLESRPQHPYLMHCFAGTPEHAKRCVELGCYFGVDGPITFPSKNELREIFLSLPRDRIVIETDSPYMSPVPYRGKPNRPAWVKHVNEGLADTLGISAEECGDLTTNNALRFFGERLTPATPIDETA